jgi:hypothetical protein
MQFAPSCISSRNARRVRSPPLSVGHEAADLLVVEQEAHEQPHGRVLGHRAPGAQRVDDGGVARQLGGLAEVADVDARPDPALPGGEREVARERPQQHALARAVRADDADPLAAVDLEVHVEQHRVRVERHVDALEARARAGRRAPRCAARAPSCGARAPAVDLVHALDLHPLHARLAGGALVDADVRPVLEAPAASSSRAISFCCVT